MEERLQPFSLDACGFLLHDGLTYVPATERLKVEILNLCHDAKTAGHLGIEKTLELVLRNYYWPGIRAFVKRYCRTCDTCARNKSSRHAPYGHLHPLPIPEGVWDSVSMDYIVELPESEGHNAIYVCVDRLTKMAHFIPTTTRVTAEQTAQLFYRYVFKDHGLPCDIVSDRGPQFISQFTRHLLEKLGIQGNRSTSHHPQSDGQTERVNQTLEQYLRVYCDYQQDNWYELLPLAEFVYNNTQNASTRMSPFFANKGYHPRCRINIATESANPAVEALADKLRTTHIELKANLQRAQERYKAQYDRHARPAPSYEIGDKVWLLRRNIRTARPSQKLDVKKMGPFRILEAVGDAKLAYRLELTPQMRIHDVFHVSLLEPYLEDKLEGRVQEAPLPEVVEGEEEWEVKEVLDSRVSRGKLLYLVDWEGFGPEDRTWEPVEHVTHATDAVAEFHRRYPHRPSPQDIPVRGQRRQRQ